MRQMKAFIARHPELGGDLAATNTYCKAAQEIKARDEKSAKVGDHQLGNGDRAQSTEQQLGKRELLNYQQAVEVELPGWYEPLVLDGGAGSNKEASGRDKQKKDQVT